MPSGNKVSILPNFSVFQERSGICFWIFKFDAINFKFKHCGQTKLLMKDLADGLQIRNPAADPATSLLPGSHMVWDSSRYIIFFFFLIVMFYRVYVWSFFLFFPHIPKNWDFYFISHILFFFFLYDIIHVLMPFSWIIPHLRHRVQKTVLYICVFFAILHTGWSLPSF